MAPILLPVVSYSIAPKMVPRNTITKRDRAFKRKTLHTIIRRITQGPLWTDGPELDQCSGQQQHIPQVVEEIHKENSTELEPSIPFKFADKTLHSEDSQSTAESDSVSSCDNRSTTEEFPGFSTSKIVTKRLDRVPARMSQLSVNSRKELIVPVNYNSKMARSFIEVENRSPTEKIKRQRNTIAARESRAKMRVMHDMLQTEAEEARTANLYLKVRLAATFGYAGLLLEKLNMPPTDFLDAWLTANEECDSSALPIGDDAIECVLEEAGPSKSKPRDVRTDQDIEE